MDLGHINGHEHKGYVFRSTEVTRALDSAKRAVLAADSAYGKLLAIREGNTLLVQLGDDGSGAADDLSDFAIGLGMNPNDVQTALAHGVKRALEDRAKPTTKVDGSDGFGFPATSSSYTSSVWPEPNWEILDGRRGNLPEFPDDVFPAGVQAWLGRAAHGAGVTTAHVAVPFLGVVSSLIGISRCICPVRAWLEPCSMWVGIVGLSGSGKTPGLDVTKRALNWVQKDRKGKILTLQLAHETRVESAKAASKKWKEEVAQAIEDCKTPPSMPACAVNPGLFVEPRLYVTDTTTQRIAVLLTATPRGQLVIVDELSGLFLNMARYANGGQDNEFWLEAWNGKSFICERMGRPAVNVDHLLVGLVGGFQPDKLEPSFGDRHDGMYARLCFSWPAEAGYRPLNDCADEVDPLLYNILTRIIDLPSEEDGVFAYRKIELSSGAVQEFEKYRNFMHQTRKDLEGREREWLSKTLSHVLRLAGTLTYIRWAAVGGPEPAAVDADSLRSAVRLVRDYFWPHSRATLRCIGLSDRETNARVVVKWLVDNRKTELSVQDVRQHALCRAVDAKEARAILQGLADHGFVEMATEDPRKQGGRPVIRWVVNPMVLSARNPGNTGNPVTGCKI